MIFSHWHGKYKYILLFEWIFSLSEKLEVMVSHVACGRGDGQLRLVDVAVPC